MLLTGCAHVSKPVKPVPCKVWTLPAKLETADAIPMTADDGTVWIAIPVGVAGWIDMYLGSVDRQQEALKACPYVEFVDIGGGDELKKVDWEKVNYEIGKVRG